MTIGQLVLWRGVTVRLIRLGRAGSGRNDAWISYKGNVRRVNAAELEAP